MHAIEWRIAGSGAAQRGATDRRNDDGRGGATAA